MCHSIYPQSFTKKLKFRYFCLDCLKQLEETEQKHQQKREEELERGRKEQEKEQKEEEEAIEMEKIVVDFIRKKNSVPVFTGGSPYSTPSGLYK